MTRRCFFLSGTWSDQSFSTHLRAMAEELARRGHQVVFIVDRQNHDVEDHDGNPAVYTWPSVRPTRLRDALFLRRLIKEYRPDCLVSAFGATNLMMTVGWLMRVPCRICWYLTIAGGIQHDQRIDGWKLRLMRKRKRLVYSIATHIVPNSSAGADDVKKVHHVPDKKCKVLYLSMPDPRKRMPELERLQPTNQAICVGRFDRVKGQDVLLRAIPFLREQFPDTEFEFVGDGPCRNDCEELAEELGIADRCRFVGWVAHDDLLRRLAQSRVSVVPSRFECFGLVNIDSMAVGTPVVASHVGGIGEIFSDGQEGYLVPPDDPKLLAERLSRILGDAQLREEMSRKALKRFTFFEQAKMIGPQIDWLESLVGGADPHVPSEGRVRMEPPKPKGAAFSQTNSEDRIGT